MTQMTATATRPQRLQHITRLISAGVVMNQRDLARQLAERGIRTTQATLSRDLAEIGVVKSAAGYSLPANGSHPPIPFPVEATRPRLSMAIRRLLISAQSAGTLVVIHTPPGQASALAIELDRIELTGKIGTIAGDDCILVACTSTTSARALARRLISGTASVSATGTTPRLARAPAATAARKRAPRSRTTR